MLSALEIESLLVSAVVLGAQVLVSRHLKTQFLLYWYCDFKHKYCIVL